MRRLTMAEWVGVALLAGCLLFASSAAAGPPPTYPFTVSPTSGAFPNTQTGATRAIKFTFTWTASETGSLSGFETASPFVVQANTCGPTISYHDTCKVTVDFAPTVVGPATGDLMFAYGGSVPGTDEIPLSGDAVAPGPCECDALAVHLRSVKEEDHGNLIVLPLHWSMVCSGGTGKCHGELRLKEANGEHHGYLTLAHHEGLRLACKGECGGTTTGEVTAELHWPQRQRHNKSVLLEVEETCGRGTTDFFHLKFDEHGRFNKEGSQLH